MTLMSLTSSTLPEAAESRSGAAGAESPKARFWLALSLVFAVTACVHLYKLDKWAFGEDEVHSLIELGLLPGNVGLLPKLLPVWYGAQGFVLRFLPHDEFGTRLLPASCGILTVVVIFAFAAQRRGLLFALGLAILLNGSQLFLWFSQQNRFYTMAMLFLTLTVVAIWSRVTGVKMVIVYVLLEVLMVIVSALLGVLTLLGHNLLLVVLVFGFLSACVAYPLGWVHWSVLVRSGAAALAGSAFYVVYLSPKGYTSSWVIGETHVVVSFIAQVGVPTFVLALFGAAACLAKREERKEMGWWAGLLVLELLFVALTPLIMSVWSARYAFLLMLPIWVLAAYGMERIARALGSLPLGLIWYGCVALLLFPKLASHYQDGSRHDFRQAARIVADSAQPGQPIHSNWEPYLKYYLPPDLRERVEGWAEDHELPASEFIAVYASTVWQPLRYPNGRRIEVLGEVYRRRFDEQSYIIRVYRVGPLTGEGAR